MWVCNEFKPYPPYLLLVIACNACACCVICGNCLAIDWHNALAACGLQRKAPVVSQLFRAENWWEKMVASWAQKEMMNFWANSIGHFFWGGSGTAHYHPTCIQSPWAFLQLCREWLKITTVTMVAFPTKVFFHLLSGSSSTSPGITLVVKCQVEQPGTKKMGFNMGTKTADFSMNWWSECRENPTKTQVPTDPFRTFRWAHFFVSGPWQGAEFTWLMTSVDVNCFEVHHAAWCEHQPVFWPQFFLGAIHNHDNPTKNTSFLVFPMIFLFLTIFFNFVSVHHP